MNKCTNYILNKEISQNRGTFYDIDVLDESAYFQKKQSDGAYEIKYKNYNLTRVTLPKKDAETAMESHKKLVSMAHEYKPEISEYRQRRKDIVEMITDELDVLAVKKLVPGRCRYCPF